jgi:ribosomal protein S9
MKMLWVNSHIRKDADIRLSLVEEKSRVGMFPTTTKENSFATHGQATHGNLFQFREFPMYPGEYIPPEHKVLSSLRQELQLDLTAQSLKTAWMKIANGHFFESEEAYYAGVEGLDADQLGEIVAATLPGLSAVEAKALVSRVLESLSKPSNSPARQLRQTISAETVGLDDAPGHYTNFIEWMGRMTETRAFKTEHALFQFSRRKFSRQDVRVMFENYSMMSRSALNAAAADRYSHFYHVLKDFAVKIAGEDTRHQIGVRIDEREVDEETGIAVGYGIADGRKYAFACLLRENQNGTGVVTVTGKPLSVAFDNRSWLMEMVLAPFDEASLNARDFDVHLVNEGKISPFIGNEISAFACRMAVASAIAKLIPVARIPLKKSGLLSVDRRQELGQYPGKLDGKKAGRRFSKR